LDGWIAGCLATDTVSDIGSPLLYKICHLGLFFCAKLCQPNKETALAKQKFATFDFCTIV